MLALWPRFSIKVLFWSYVGDNNHDDDGAERLGMVTSLVVFL